MDGSEKSGFIFEMKSLPVTKRKSMKKQFILILFLACAVILQAQTFQLGVKAGANISNFSGGNFEAVKKSALIGFHGGLFLRFKFGRIGLQPEAMISSQGAKIDSFSNGHSVNWKVTYVTIPLMLQYYFKSRFYVEAGPQAGFKTTDDFGNTTLNDFASNLDLAAAAGIGYRSKSGFGLGTRYTAGIS